MKMGGGSAMHFLKSRIRYFVFSSEYSYDGIVIVFNQLKYVSFED